MLSNTAVHRARMHRADEAMTAAQTSAPTAQAAGAEAGGSRVRRRCQSLVMDVNAAASNRRLLLS